jgi:hypothetical protein
LTLRKGPFENELVGRNDFRVFEAARSLQGAEGIIYSEPNQGAVYAYMYEGVRVTNGRYGLDGFISEDVAYLTEAIRSPCDYQEIYSIFKRQRIAGVLLSVRNAAWEGAAWSKDEIENLRGMTIKSRGTYSYLLVPNQKNCEE